MPQISDKREEYKIAISKAKDKKEKIEVCRAFIEALKWEIKDCYSYL